MCRTAVKFRERESSPGAGDQGASSCGQDAPEARPGSGEKALGSFCLGLWGGKPLQAWSSSLCFQRVMLAAGGRWWWRDRLRVE